MVTSIRIDLDRPNKAEETNITTIYEWASGVASKPLWGKLATCIPSILGTLFNKASRCRQKRMVLKARERIGESSTGRMLSG
ncbi:hypothetical protein E4T56_gene16316 [Termitomyces sp. T112]|nr:hypothetical protein E4T56_gene16316 [Termitomyces sp. T112]